MRAVFESEGWAVNRIEKDYAVDFDVQVFEGNKATGEWFKVQLKSSMSTDYSTNADFISEELPRDHASHYSTKIRDPIFLIHADVISKRTFWFAPQLADSISTADKRSNITFRIPSRNELPASLPDMVTSLRHIRIRLGAKAVSDSPIEDFAKSVQGEDPEELIRNLQDRTDLVRIQAIHNQVSHGDLSESRRRLEELISNSHSSAQIKVSALLEEERVQYLSARRSSAPQGAIPQIHLAISKRLQLVTKEGPRAFKFFALVARQAAELDVLTFKDFGLFMNWMSRVKGEDSDPLSALHVATERLRSTHLVIRKYDQCVRLARYAASSRHRWALPRALLRVAQSMAVFLMRLRAEGHEGDAQRYRESVLQFVRMAVWIAERNNDDQSLSLAATAALLLVTKADEKDDSRPEIIALARDAASKIKDREQAEATNETLARGLRRMAGERVEGDPEPDIEKQIIENIASGLGIDIADESDPTVRLIRMGINDMNPERVIRHCVHAFVSISGRVPPGTGMLASLLRLPSLNAKVIHCDLHNYAVEARWLDTASEAFKKNHCEGCKDVSPWDAEWKYSDEWVEAENLRHKDFMGNFWQRRSRE